MNAVDGSDHYSKTSDEPPPSLLTIILDTNPHAWALLAPTLPLSAAIANLIVFINAHLAFNNANKVCVIASHTRRAEFLYPPRPKPPNTNPSAATASGDGPTTTNNGTDSDDEAMPDHDATSPPQKHSQTLLDDANHYRPFSHIQRTLLSALDALFASTNPDSLTATTAIAGALTLALTYINKQQLLASSANAGTSTTNTQAANDSSAAATATQQPPALISRILLISVSGDLAHQYIPLMNTIFACQRMSIPIDIAKVAGDTVFLQQASDATGGVYIKIKQPKGLLQYLMMAFLPDQTARGGRGGRIGGGMGGGGGGGLVGPTSEGVDFRAACFCHRKVVDVGFVCSICLSIFCSPPEGATCLTCGTHLKLGNYGGKPAVVAKKKKKRKEKG